MVDEGIVVVADLEAGIGTLTRLDEAAVDATVIVVEPTPRSIDVAARALAIARERRQGRIVVVANKVAGDDDIELIRAGLDLAPALAVPDDPEVIDADRRGESIVDGSGPAARALVELEALVQDRGPGASQR